MIDRREFLKSTSTAMMSLSGGAVGAAFGPTAARAEVVTAVLAAVAIIAGAIAAHNRRDVGAILAEAQRQQNAIMIKQLASLQNGMSALITQNQEILQKLAEVPFETNAIRYRGMLVGALWDYQEETSKDGIIQNSLARRLTRAQAARVRSVTDKLRSARNELIGSGVGLDPLLSMALCSACMAEIQGLGILADRAALAKVVDRTRDVLDATLKNVPGTAGGVLDSCEKNLAAQIKLIAESAVWKTGEVGRAAIALDVQDFAPAQKQIEMREPGPLFHPDGPPNISIIPAVPQRVGDLVRIWSEVAIRRVDPLDDKEIRARISEDGIQAYQNRPEAERFFLEMVEYSPVTQQIRNPGSTDPALPKNPQKLSIDLNGSRADAPFIAAASNAPQWKAQIDLVNNPRTGLRLMVDQANLIRARREIAAQAVDTVKSTIITLDAIRRA